MDTYSILDNNSSQAAPKTASPSIVFSGPASSSAGAAAAPARARETLRFPGEDGGKSLSEMAQRDLDATLQLLAERAQYITGASGVAIALRQGDDMICSASVGPSAPELGAHLQIDSGLSAESVRTRKTLHCEDAANDSRVNRESCRAFGIASVVVMPLVRGEEVFGVFELLASRPHAFEDRDFVALQRLAEMIQTAVEHAEAARRAEKELGGKPGSAVTAVVKPVSEIVKPAASPAETSLEKQIAPPNGRTELETATKSAPVTEVAPGLDTNLATTEITAALGEPDEPLLTGPIPFGNVGRCQACAFPVSPGRRLCLDCEAITPNTDLEAEDADMFSQASSSDVSWVRSHVYLVATVLVVAATVVVLIWRF
jgi:putative methionine-R-sulfoxide reductase with GAF domain